MENFYHGMEKYVELRAGTREETRSCQRTTTTYYDGLELTYYIPCHIVII